ncbi:MAG: hypothetical protein ACLR6J_16015 [Parabacteroides merdae]
MQLTNYLQLLGTESLSFEQFRSRLQSIGSTLAFDVTPDAFVMKVTGFDNHIDETMELVGDFIRHAKADDKEATSDCGRCQSLGESLFQVGRQCGISFVRTGKVR